MRTERTAMNLVKATLFDADREFPQRDAVLFCVCAPGRFGLVE
jgi:hypothetical protein